MNGFPHLANLLRESALERERQNRIAERCAARKAEARDYNISDESRAALERGDRQRATGVYQTDASEPTLGGVIRACLRFLGGE